jgi:hypothetical protein
MHTTKGKKAVFNHNGDFSGDVRIYDTETKQEMWIPFDDLKALVAAYVRTEKISRLEQEEDDKTLGL